MIVCRAYTVMDQLQVEATCYHGRDPEASHLIIRELRRPVGPELSQQLRCLADALELAALITQGQPCPSPRD